jgi:phosphate uptake regulator
MTSRKLVKQGRNALTLTVPASWIHKRKLAAGDLVTVTEQGESLLVRPGTGSTSKTVAIDLRGADSSTTWHLLASAYIEGSDTITVQHDNAERIQQIAGHLLGTVLDELTPKHARITSIMAAPREPIDAALRRCGHLFGELARTLERVARAEAKASECKAIERTLDDTLTYCLRVLNTYERDERAYQRFLLCMWIEMGADYVSMLAEEIGSDTLLATTVRRGVEDYVHGIFADDYKSLFTRMRAMRASIKKKSFADGIAYALADMLYNNIGVFTHDRKYQGA